MRYKVKTLVDNTEWQVVLNTASYQEALQKFKELRAAGQKATVIDTEFPVEEVT